MPSVVGLLVLLVAGDCYMILPAFVMSLTCCRMNSGRLVSTLMVPKHLDKNAFHNTSHLNTATIHKVAKFFCHMHSKEICSAVNYICQKKKTK